MAQKRQKQHKRCFQHFLCKRWTIITFSLEGRTKRRRRPRRMKGFSPPLDLHRNPEMVRSCHPHRKPHCPVCRETNLQKKCIFRTINYPILGIDCDQTETQQSPNLIILLPAGCVWIGCRMMLSSEAVPVLSLPKAGKAEPHRWAVDAVMHEDPIDE